MDDEVTQQCTTNVWQPGPDQSVDPAVVAAQAQARDQRLQQSNADPAMDGVIAVEDAAAAAADANSGQSVDPAAAAAIAKDQEENAKVQHAQEKFDECISVEEKAARLRCHNGYLPTMKKQPGMTDDQCVEMSRDGWAGGSSTRERTDGTKRGSSDKGSVEGDGKILGVGVKAGYERSEDYERSRDDMRGRTDNDRTFDGYAIKCEARRSKDLDAATGN